MSGKFRYEAESPSDYPAVGDFVLLQCVNKNDIAVIQKVLPRKSVFLRKAAGTNSVEQIVAANIDTVFICMSLNNDFNVRRYSLDEITEIFCKLGLRICNSFADFSGKPSSDNDIQLMVYSIRE